MIQYLTNYLKPKEQFGASEVEWAYRQFLKRAPESPEVIRGHLRASKNLKQLIEKILASQEYKNRSTGLKDSQTHKRSYPLTLEERVAMTCRCRDCDSMPKVPDAGRVIDFNGQRVQIMHEGSRVIADGYCGSWMTRIIESLRGHHEPQEELVFHHILKHVRPKTRMVEIGAFWAYYSNWYLGAVSGSEAILVEPDENHLACGKVNLELNGRSAMLVNACIGSCHIPSVAMSRESDHQVVNIPSHNMESLLKVIGERPIELLHIDAQGAELPFLSSARDAVERGLVRFLVVSTHHESISGSPTTHQDCVHEILAMGGVILAEHPVEESFSGDGLIAASFSPNDRGIFLPKISVNLPQESLFGPDVDSAPYEIAQTKFGSMIVSSKDRVISRMLLDQKNFEKNKIEEVASFVIKKFGFVPETFVDIGANIGTHIVSAMASGRFISGIAVEMEESNFELLQANLALNHLSGRTRLFRTALSDACSWATMELCADNYGDYRIRLDGTPLYGDYQEQERLTQKVFAVTLDRLLSDEALVLGRRALVWMDTQGHEGQVLAGGRQTLQGPDAPYLVMEFWPYGLERAGALNQYFEFLERCTAIYNINADGWATDAPLSPDGARSLFTEIRSRPDGLAAHTDLLCIP
jgi:FkbM family methyltransferase